MINNTGTINNDEGGTLTNHGLISGGALNNDGTLTNFGKISGQISNGDIFGGSGTFTNDGTVTGGIAIYGGTFVNNGTVVNSGGMSVYFTSQVTNNGDIVDASQYLNHAQTTNNGTIYIKVGAFFDNSPGDSDGYLLNNGKIIVAGSMTNGVVNEIDSPGTLVITATGELENAFVINTNGLINNGTITNEAYLTNGGTLTNGGIINNVDDLSFEDRHATLSTNTLINTGTVNEVLGIGDSFVSEVSADTLINRGTINDDGMIFNNTAFDNRGTLNITSAGVFDGPSRSGGTFLQTAGQTIVNGTLNSAATIQIQGGTLSGSGTINGNVVMGGKISPGNSPGILTINGNYTQTAAGVYDAEIAGLTPGSGYDQLLISGAADLDGKLDVNFLDGFTVDLGDSFILMKYNSEKGTYSMVELPKLGPGLKWDLTYDPGYLDLSVAPATVNPTPEPSTYLLWGTAGLLGLGIWARRKFRRASERSI